MSTHNICFPGEIKEMSIHNICFPGEIKEIDSSIF